MQKLRVLFILIGALLILNAAAALWISNMHAGILLTCFMGVLFLAVGIFYRFFMGKIHKAIRYVFYAGTALAVVLLCLIFVYGMIDNTTYKEDAVIVLGAGVRGEEVSQSLKRRLDEAAAYSARNPDAVIVVSGGQGPGESVTEALAMERYLVSQGIPENRIIKEESSTSTKKNFLFSKEKLDQYFDTPYRVCFISNDYHIFRAGIAAKTAGYSEITHVSAGTPWILAIPSGLREILAIVKYMIS